LTGSLKNDWDKNFAALVRSERTRIGVREKWTSAADLSDSPEFFPFGISDTAIARLASEALVVTGDYRLSGFLRKRGVSALNFNDLRRLRLYKND
jgi:hypothetical protein